jgi:hypothetical protein
VNIKALVFWDVTACILVTYVSEEHIASIFHPEDEGSMFYQGNGNHPSDYTSSHPRRM